MLCQKCNKNQASFYFKQVVNGATEEYQVCPECAHEMGLDGMFKIPQFGLGLDSFLSNMLGLSTKTPHGAAESSETCPLCGSTAIDVSRMGRPGCATCYDVFQPMLEPYIRRIHGKTSHTGGIPASAGIEVTRRRQIDQLKTDMRQAIENQEFERAAEIRDELKRLEGSDNG